jgi:transcriptional regulator with XRE-family HTH domain
MIKEFRLSIDQSIEALALLMQMEPDEYARLEEDWIPPPDILQRLCSLFEWNYQEISRLARNTPQRRPGVAVPESTASSQRRPLHELMRDARMEVEQTQEGIATLLSIPVDYYQALEEGVAPNDELLRKICSLFNWNYLQMRQRLISDTSPSLGPYQPPLPAREIRARFPEKPLPPEFNQPAHGRVSFGARLRDARLEVGQSLEGMALLLQIPPDLYEQIETDQAPLDTEMLRHISALFEWNYHEVINHYKSQNRQLWQPSVTHLQGPEPHRVRKLQGLQDEISAGWRDLNVEQQDALLSQMELVRDTIDRWKMKNKL